MSDINKAIRMAIETGKVCFGSKECMKAVLRGEGKLIIIAENCSEKVKVGIIQYAKLSQLPIYVYSGSSLELGSVCGKPFPISTITIFEQGNSDILEITKGK